MRSLVLGIAFSTLSAFGMSPIKALGETIDPAEIVQVVGEELKIQEAPPNRHLGTRLAGVKSLKPLTGEPSYGPVRYALDPDSLVIRFNGRILKEGKDYILDHEFGTLGLGNASSIRPDDQVLADYRYAKQRIDSQIQLPDGRTIIRKGKSRISEPPIPELLPDEKRLANIYVPAFSDGTDAVFLPVLKTPDQIQTATQAGMIPKTMKKIQAGMPVRVTCWGDSVTVGADVGDSARNSFVSLLQQRLNEKFPSADITVNRVAVGGSTSTAWLDGTRAGCDFNRVITPKPDLVVIEFLNDARTITTKEAFLRIYTEILDRLTPTEAEIIFITPNYSMFDWPDIRGKDERPYIGYLRDFAAEHNIAVADASARWENLWQEGIPWPSLLGTINHPNAGGHILYAEELIKCFK